MVNRKVMADLLDIKLDKIVLELKELGCNVTREKLENGRWIVSTNFSEVKTI